MLLVRQCLLAAFGNTHPEKAARPLAAILNRKSGNLPEAALTRLDTLWPPDPVRGLMPLFLSRDDQRLAAALLTTIAEVSLFAVSSFVIKPHVAIAAMDTTICFEDHDPVYQILVDTRPLLKPLSSTTLRKRSGICQA